MGILDAPAASPAFARRVSRPSNTIVWLGDSITGNGGRTSGGIANISYHPRGFWCHAQAATGHRLRTLANAGVGGETTTQILARVQSDVIALKPGWCHAQGGTNDISAATPLATIQANLSAIWDALDNAGIRVITGTIPPRQTYTGSQKADTENMNAWIRAQGQARTNLIVVDYYSVLAFPASGTYSTGGVTYDGIHPSSIGAHLMGQLFAQTVGPHIPQNTILCTVETDATNLIPGGRFIGAGWTDKTIPGTVVTTQARTDVVQGSWKVFTTPAQPAWSASTAKTVGQWVHPTTSNGLFYRCTTAGTTGATEPTWPTPLGSTVTDGTVVWTQTTPASWVQFNVSVGANLAVGDLVSFAIEYELTGLDPNAVTNQRGFYVRLQSYNGTTQTDMIYDMYWVRGSQENMSAMDRSGVLRTPPVAVPAGTTQVLALIHMEGPGTYKLDRATMHNLTRLGMSA